MINENLNTKSFGKNDIRGIFPSEVNSKLFFHAARGYVKWVKNEFKKSDIDYKYEDMVFTVSMDARLHSKELKDSLIEGIITLGANVVDLGLAPTPIGYFSEFAKIDSSITSGKKITGALIITASHNPSEYNGLKMTFNKSSLSESDIQGVKKCTEDTYELSAEGSFGTYKKGFVRAYDIIPAYIDKVLAGFANVNGNIKIVVDSANATGGLVGPKLYKEMGCEVIELFSEPDGTFPNHHPNPSVESTLDVLKETVIQNRADFGIAFDGDSDRIGVVDSAGKMITGDKLLLIYAQDLIHSLKSHGEKPVVVSEVKCSQVLYDTIDETGGKAVMCKTGHGYIKSKMKETGALLAGEMSGHVFFKDRYYGFDDAFYAGCRLVEIVAKNKQGNPDFKIQSLLTPFDKVHLSKEVRLDCPNELKGGVLEEIKTKVNDEIFNSKIKEILTIDGLRIIFEDGFALIRQSNTEPVFTLRFEAKTQDKCESYQNTLTNLANDLVQKHKSLKV